MAYFVPHDDPNDRFDARSTRRIVASGRRERPLDQLSEENEKGGCVKEMVMDVELEVFNSSGW